MTMDCGRVNIKNQVISEEGNESLDKLAPWTVGIYRNNFELELLFCGSIIAPNIVISEARHFLKDRLKFRLGEQTSLNDGQYKIGGLPLTQKMIEPVKNLIDVKIVYLKNTESGYADISVLVLAKKVPFGNGFAPVCIDWHREYHIRNKAPLKIIGTEIIPYNAINRKICMKKMKKFYSHEYSHLMVRDKFCIRLREQDVEYRLPGAGISSLHYNTNFLTGVIPYQVFNLHGKIINDTIFGMTKIRNHLLWIKTIFNKHVTVNSCVLPTVEGVIYSNKDSNEILPHGTIIDRYLKVIESCDIGYHKAYPIGFRFCLGKGKWLTSSDKLCLKMCRPLLSDSLDIKCSYSGKYANCSNLSIPDTIATPKCKSASALPNGQKETPLELVCQSNGIWNNKLYECFPHCGLNRRTKLIKDRPLPCKFGEVCSLLGGNYLDETIVASWNVGVYKFNVKNISKYDLICGGSIISPHLVVSAAHCFWENGMSSRNKSINYGLFKIAVGKYSRDIEIIDDYRFTEIMNVENVYLYERYYGLSGSHAGDIAVVLLQNEVSYGIGVGPICIDWNGNYNVVNGALGQIVGWGRTEKGVLSDILLTAYLPYIDHSSCREMYTNEFESYVTADKFCAGSESGQGVSVGDSGSGLCYSHSNSYYLTGVTSVKDPHTKNSIATFTDIQHHIKWIRKLYDEHY